MLTIIGLLAFSINLFGFTDAGYSNYMQRSAASYYRGPVPYYSQRHVASVSRYSANDFNPELLGGIYGYPGIKVRVNQRAFMYATAIASGMIDDQIRRARIPDVTQCIPQVNGCVRVSGLYVAAYRCAQRIALYPVPPNHLIATVQNFDIQVNGFLGGQIVVLLPIPLCGQICVTLHQVSVTLDLVVERAANGAPYVRVAGCLVTLGYVDAYIANGGIIGAIINAGFRGMISQQIRNSVPAQLCGVLPGVVAQQINPRLAGIPQSISFPQIAQMVSSMINRLSSVPAYCYSPQCRQSASNGAASSVPVANAPTAAAYASPGRYQHRALAKAAQTRIQNYAPRNNVHWQASQARFNAQTRHFARAAPVAHQLAVSTHRARRSISSVSSQQCAGCPKPGGMSSALLGIFRSLQLNRLSDIVLTTQIVAASATFNDYTIALNGEFSPRGMGGTPFRPFPMNFPYAVGAPMVEILISDFTINSLLYQMHRRHFLEFRINAAMPNMGSLLSLSCDGSDYDDEGETETTDNELIRAIKRHRKLRRKKLQRHKRQADMLEDLGVCFGDIAPALRSKYPDKRVDIFIHTIRAPSITFRNQGIVRINLMAEAVILLEGTNNRIGSLGIYTVIDIAARFYGTSVSGSGTIQVLKITDRGGTLGMSPDAFDSLAGLVKDQANKMLNDLLKKGMTIPMPALNIPVSFNNVRIGVMDHALYIGTDIAAASNLFGPQVCIRY